jgi:hypothetical protein
MSYCAAPPFRLRVRVRRTAVALAEAVGTADIEYARSPHTTRTIDRAQARPEWSGSTRASRWLGIALIVWLAGAIAGLAMLPESKVRPEGHAKPPATFPIDIQVPTAHDLPAVA